MSSIDTDPRALDTPVPAMILQPLVENAVRHGVAVREEPTRVTVCARIVGADSLVLSVSNDGPDTPMPTDGLGVGLANVRARLEELYGHDSRFTAEPTADGRFRAEVTLPLARRIVPNAPARVLEAQLA